jgi:Tol biopolymer transport system component
MRVLLPKWSPDGRQIAFAASFPGRPWNIYLISAEGGTPKQVLPDAEDRVDGNWSSDGNSLFFGSFGGNLHGQHPISILDLRTAQISTLPGSVGLFSPRLSPDAHYMCAITSEEPFRLMLFDFSTQQWTRLFASDVGYPSWSHDGSYIYFERNHFGHARSKSVDRIRVSDRKSESIVDLKNLGRSATGTITEWIGLAPDDSPLLARDISTHEIYSLQLYVP